MTTTITTDLAPAAKPIPASMTLTTYYRVLLETPQYNIPVQGFGQSRRIAPGLIEVSSPLIVCCKTDQPARIDVMVWRAGGIQTQLVRDFEVVPQDTTLIPLNGLMLLSGDRLVAKASTDDRLDVTISATVGQAEEDQL